MSTPYRPAEAEVVVAVVARSGHDKGAVGVARHQQRVVGLALLGVRLVTRTIWLSHEPFWLAVIDWCFSTAASRGERANPTAAWNVISMLLKPPVYVRGPSVRYLSVGLRAPHHVLSLSKLRSDDTRGGPCNNQADTPLEWRQPS